MILLVGAYGRAYKTLDDAEADWNAGKDFKIFKGPYCSIRDLPLLKEMGHGVVLTAGTTCQLTKILCGGV